jgi:uncharacterized protein YaiI (UPF0178 family)
MRMPASKVVKDILYRAAERTGVTVTLVENQALLHPAEVIAKVGKRSILAPSGTRRIRSAAP